MEPAKKDPSITLGKLEVCRAVPFSVYFRVSDTLPCPGSRQVLPGLSLGMEVGFGVEGSGIGRV